MPVLRVLITGVSGVGKSTVTERLRAAGHEAVDLDDPAWSEWVTSADGNGPSFDRPGQDWVWREDRVRTLLTAERDTTLFVSGCSPTLGDFLHHLDLVILLSAPAEVMAERLTTRTTNSYGKRPAELVRSLEFKETVEPLLRAVADLEIDTTAPVDEVVRRVLGGV